MKRILVVDDDPDILSSLELLLQSQGYDVITASQGDQARGLTEAKADVPALIILDMLLSGDDGRVITKKLKNYPKTKHIPIVMISAHPDARRDALAVGADDFLAKPFEIDHLLEKVRHYI